MPDLGTLICFLGASIALTVAPGPDNIFVISIGMARGRRPAIATALGMCSGISVHTSAAAFGLSAIFYSSAVAFNSVKYAGAAYLLFLAWKIVRNPGEARFSPVDERPDLQLFRRGFIMNVLNPKVALFFLSFLPQFIAPARGAVPIQMLLLGLVFMLQAVVIFCTIGYFSGWIGGMVQSRPRLTRRFDLATAGVFAALGIRLAITQR